MLQQMIVLFLVMLVGFLAYKKNYINDNASKKLSSIVVNIANPALILSSVLSMDNTITGKDLITTVILAIAVFAGLLIISIFIPIIFRVEKQSAGAYQVMTVFSNIGFMGFPIISSVYGSSALLYATLFLIPYNILIYTYGIHTMKAGKKEGKEKLKIGQILNIGVIACILAILLFIFHVKLPEFLGSVITMLSNLTAPLSMMVIGASMAVIDWKKLLSDYRLLLFSLFKLFVLPIIGTLIVKQVISNEVICGVTMVMLATPVGSMTAMLAQEYNGDYELASKGVMLSTLLSVVTLPIVSAIVM
ncbi:MAG: AEC family transporter [Lachnospiraceae bacterium]|nr:AEC family transporter [Lachnospiraceae bacterium]